MTAQTTSGLFEKHKALLDQAVDALKQRVYFTPYPENPRAYAEDADQTGKAAFLAHMNSDFRELLQGASSEMIGEEVSPYLQVGLGTRYPAFTADQLISHARNAQSKWAKTSIETRVGLLIEALEKVKDRFFEIAYATMHTTGQSYMMSFQASGPHANDRALEAIAMGYEEQTRFVNEVEWVKNMGKFDIRVQKNFKAVPKGISLVIGCSTFPTWNTVPGLFASLVTGNAVIVKPHPKAILPIAIVVAELQKVFSAHGVDAQTVQLAADTASNPITKQLAENSEVKLVDFTGSSAFGNYVENLPNKTTFTEKAGVNSVILDSAADLKVVAQNIAFAVSLYSGQMCTAPQNIFVPATGVKSGDTMLSYDEVVQMITTSISELVNNPKIGAGTLGSIQAEATYQRVKQAASLGGKVALESHPVANAEFEHARTASPAVIEVTAGQKDVFHNECFGPIVFIIKTASTEESLQLTRELAQKHGAITCQAYTTSNEWKNRIEEEMNDVFTPVSFNFTGALLVNSHAAFSDFHVTGGNPAGNASFTSPEFITRRFVWVGNRFA